MIVCDICDSEEHERYRTWGDELDISGHSKRDMRRVEPCSKPIPCTSVHSADVTV